MNRMEILVTRMKESPVADGPMEIVERKGVGHPDTLCDGAAEALSIALCKHYIDRFGRILHHNVDKVARQLDVDRPLEAGLVRAAQKIGVWIRPYQTFDNNGEKICRIIISNPAKVKKFQKELSRLKRQRIKRVSSS